MKVEGTRTRTLGSIRNQKRTARTAEGGFASELVAGKETSAPAASGTVDVLDSVLAVQEVADDAQHRREARSRGEDLLGRLEQIRVGLLAGRIPVHQLNELLRVLKGRRSRFSDPRLNEILDEIELRAAVELAKLGYYD